MTNFTMAPNGTLTHWKAADGSDILFPEQEIEIGHGSRLRGGAPVCCPNFGTAPTDGPYEGIRLPQHGLVRDSRLDENGLPVPESPCVHQHRMTDDGWDKVRFNFCEPWIHQAEISVRQAVPQDDERTLHHSIQLRADCTTEVTMPYSIGFHPYFATQGEPFAIHHGGIRWSSNHVLFYEARFEKHRHPLPISVELGHGTVELELTNGYNGFYMWTDRPDLYICVEPVLVDEEKRWLTLRSGGQVNCDCSLVFVPK